MLADSRGPDLVFRVFKIFTDFADLVAFLLLICFAATWLLRRRSSQALSFIIVPVLITAIFTLILKAVIHQGPGESLRFLHFSFQLPFPFFSFPSGHTSRAFAPATALGIRFPRLSISFYAIAALIGFSRIYLGTNDLIEVLGGAIHPKLNSVSLFYSIAAI